MSRTCSKQYPPRRDFLISKERTQRMNTLSREGKISLPLCLFLQSLHLRCFLFLCVMPRKVGLLISMRANYFPYHPGTVYVCVSVYECTCVSECGYSISAREWDTNSFHRGKNWEVFMQNTEMKMRNTIHHINIKYFLKGPINKK